VASVCTACFNIKTKRFAQNVCFARLSEHIATISLNTNRSVYVTIVMCVSCAVETEFFNVISRKEETETTNNKSIAMVYNIRSSVN
jgi:hypothetical protein